MEDNLLAKLAGPVLKQGLNPCAHIRAVKQRRSQLVYHRIGLADATLEICSDELLAGGESQSRTSG